MLVNAALGYRVEVACWWMNSVLLGRVVGAVGGGALIDGLQ